MTYKRPRPQPLVMSNVRVGSRWWYWVAAVPLVTAFWVVSSLWVAVVAVVVPEAVVADVESLVSIPAVALGVPALVVFAVLPLALWRDARDVAAAGGDWPSDTGRPAKLAAVVDVAVIGGGALFFEGVTGTSDTLAVGALLLGAGLVAGTWLSASYLRERAEHVAMPSNLWEWRRELRAGDQREPAN